MAEQILAELAGADGGEGGMECGEELPPESMMGEEGGLPSEDAAKMASILEKSFA